MVSESFGLRTKIPYFSFLTFILILIGSRYETGPDWATYESIYETSCQTPMIELQGVELLYRGLNCLSYSGSFDLLFVNIICALIILCSCFYFAKLCLTPSIFYIFAMPYFLYVISMSYTRQSVAISLFMLSIYLSVNFRKTSIWAISLIGFGFHKSILLYSGLLLYKTIPKLAIYLLLIPALIFLALYSLGGYFEYLVSNYVEGDFSSTGALFRITFSCFCSTAYYFLIRAHIPANVRNVINIFTPLPYIYFLFLVVWPNQNTAIDRISLYQIPVNILICSYAPLAFPEKYFLVLKNVAFLISFLLFQGWLSYTSFRDAWLPYKSYFFVL
ncbi:EpsG family protein [Polynucleobacter sp. 80A-SIGWE]|uniref:EpsG family protein n=1 Tax=Polynucleobacter sp. 80A-SIGWE TaxID=2689100 RepID=UPI00351CCC19|nr:EpsG family protein [Polynucleobacter sp. 80A-SIGWE]